MNHKRFFLINTLLFMVIVGLGIGGFYYYNQQMNFITTEDAKISGDLIPITADAQGKLTEWNIKNGTTVKKGDLLGKVMINKQTVQITAPQNGTILQTNAHAGQLIMPGQTLAQLVDLNKLYITANIEEQEITDINVGQKVDVVVDAINEQKINGTVKEIGHATNSLFSLFPTENTSGNYTKVVQRIPIKIELESYPEKVIPGMNATVKIHK